MERVLPKTLDYTDVLPLAVESRSRRRTFFPINGASFNSDGANIIRIDLSADALLDTQHSYLRFNFSPNVRTCGIDFAGGHSFIRRLRVEQSGVVLEDINAYNRLMGAVVLPCQSSDEHHKERTITEAVRGFASAPASADLGTIHPINTGDADSTRQAIQLNNNSDGQMSVARSYKFCIPLNSGILNNSKLLPLMLMSAPLTIEIELASSVSAVCWNTDATGNYDITDVRYVANLVEVGGDVSQQLRMVQEMSGGVLTLAGQTYRHFTGATTAGSGDQIINVPARVKSMKSLFFVNQGTDGDAYDKFNISCGFNNSLNSYQLKIGSVVYPPTPIQCLFGTGSALAVYDNRSECLMELAKSWGNVGSSKGIGQLNWFNYMNTNAVIASSQQGVQFGPCGIDLEAFQRVAIESGVNTADRSLPISLVLNFASNAKVMTYDVYVLADALFYINADGSMSVSV